MYLLEETPEAADLRQNVFNLLTSSDSSNSLLAFQIMEAGGIHRDFVGILCASVIHEYGDYDRAEAEEKPFLAFCKKNKVFAAKDLRWILKYCTHNWGYCWNVLSEQIAKRALREPNFFLAPYWQDILSWGLTWSNGENVSTCMKYNIPSIKQYLEEQIYHGSDGTSSIMLNYYNMEDLPDVLADLKVESIYMESSLFKNLRRKKWQNPHVTYIDYNENLPLKKLRLIARCFPAYAQWVYKKRRNYLTTAVLKCIPKAKRDVKFYTLCAECYKKEGDIAAALRWYLYLFKQYPDYQEECFTLRIAACYALLRDKAQMLHWLQLYIAETPYDVAKDVYLMPEFNRYRKSRDLQKLLKAAPPSVYLAS